MHEIFKQVLQADPKFPVEEVLRDVTILFADEDHEMLAMFKHIVAELNWKGIFVHSAIEMIERVNQLLTKECTLDAVVAEVNYLAGPAVTGITAAREIRKAMPNVPIVFLSSYVTTSLVREEIRRVDAEYLPKPFDVTQLFVRLSKLIYWYRFTMDRTYQSTHDERRANSVNRTSNNRRVTDYVLSTPTRIEKALCVQGENNNHERGQPKATE